MGQLQIRKKGNLAREGLGLVRTQKKKKKKAEGTHPLEQDSPGHAKTGASEGESAAMMVVIWCIRTVREGQIREKKTVATHRVVWQQGWGQLGLFRL